MSKLASKCLALLPGAVLPGDFKIKPTKMRGQVSNGMLCSGKELGIPDDVDGLMVLLKLTHLLAPTYVITWL